MEKLEKRISKEDFFEYLDKSKERSDMIFNVYKSTGKSLDLINFEDYITEPYRILVKHFFSNVELDYISWYLYEYEEGKMKIYDNDGLIADIIDNEALWNFLNRDDMKCWESIEKEEFNTSIFDLINGKEVWK